MALIAPDYSASHYMQILLRTARALIEAGDSSNICSAVARACGPSSCYDKQRLRARDLILDHVQLELAGSSTLGVYIIERVELVDPAAAAGFACRNDDWFVWIFQQCRLAWIDKMIFDLEAPQLEAEHWAALEERWADKSLD